MPMDIKDNILITQLLEYQGAIKSPEEGGGGTGEANTGQNIGTEGLGVYNDKEGVVLRFKNLVSKSASIILTPNGTNHTIEISFNPGGITHAGLIGAQGTQSHAVIDGHLLQQGNPHGTAHSDLSDAGTHPHTDIDAHLEETNNNPHGVSLSNIVGGTFDDLSAVLTDRNLTGGATRTPLSIYLSPTGSDTTGNGSQGNPYASFQRAFKDIPQVIKHNVTIFPATGNYTDFPENLRFNFEGGVLVVDGSFNPDTAIISNQVITGRPAYAIPFSDSSRPLTQIVVAGSNWGVNSLAVYWVKMKTGSSAGMYYPILKNTADSILLPYVNTINDINPGDIFDVVDIPVKVNTHNRVRIDCGIPQGQGFIGVENPHVNFCGIGFFYLDGDLEDLQMGLELSNGCFYFPFCQVYKTQDERFFHPLYLMNANFGFTTPTDPNLFTNGDFIANYYGGRFHVTAYGGQVPTSSLAEVILDSAAVWGISGHLKIVVTVQDSYLGASAINYIFSGGPLFIDACAFEHEGTSSPAVTGVFCAIRVISAFIKKSGRAFQLYFANDVRIDEMLMTPGAVNADYAFEMQGSCHVQANPNLVNLNGTTGFLTFLDGNKTKVIDGFASDTIYTDEAECIFQWSSETPYTRKIRSWKFISDTTDSNPGAGNFKLNNVNKTLATFIYINPETSAGVGLTLCLSALKTDDTLLFQQGEGPSASGFYQVTGAVVAGVGYYKVPVAWQSGNAVAFVVGVPSMLDIQPSTAVVDLSTVPLLAGRVGGQTLNGGTQAGEDLLLKDNPVDNQTVGVKQVFANLYSYGNHFAWSFFTGTGDSDPGPGAVRINNAAKASATFIYIDILTSNGVDVSAQLATLKTDDFVYLQQSDGNTATALYQLTGPSVNGSGYYKLPVIYRGGGAGQFVQGTTLKANFTQGVTTDLSTVPLLAGRVGGQTLTGGTLTGQDLTLRDNPVDGSTVTVKEIRNFFDAHGNIDSFVFITGTTDSDPGSGNFKLNNANKTLATYLYIDDVSHNGVNMTSWFAKLKIGDLVLVQQSEAANASALFELSGAPVAATGYYKLPVTYKAGGAAAFANNKPSVFQFESVGVSFKKRFYMQFSDPGTLDTGYAIQPPSVGSFSGALGYTVPAGFKIVKAIGSIGFCNSSVNTTFTVGFYEFPTRNSYVFTAPNGVRIAQLDFNIVIGAQYGIPAESAALNVTPTANRQIYCWMDTKSASATANDGTYILVWEEV